MGESRIDMKSIQLNRNKSGYADPTACIAIRNADKELEKKRKKEEYSTYNYIQKGGE